MYLGGRCGEPLTDSEEVRPSRHKEERAAGDRYPQLVG